MKGAGKEAPHPTTPHCRPRAAGSGEARLGGAGPRAVCGPDSTGGSQLMLPRGQVQWQLFIGTHTWP